MYELSKYKRLSYLSMYNAFNNLAFSKHKGIMGFLFSGECYLHKGGSSFCKDCKYSLKVEIPFGSINVYQYLCVYCISKLYNMRSILDDLFVGDYEFRYTDFKRTMERCGL